MSKFTSEPLSPVTAAVETSVLADWLGVDATDPLVPVMALTATATVIEYLESELITRNRKTVYEIWPTVGTDTRPGLSRNNESLCYDVLMPYGRDMTVTTIEAGGSAVDAADYRLLFGFPAYLRFETIPAIIADDVPALSVTYSAGYGASPSDIPQEIRTAVMMAADFLYNNRGSCSAADALVKSGAATVIEPYRAHAVIL